MLPRTLPHELRREFYKKQQTFHRPTRRGAWYYNPEADRNATQVEEMDSSACIIREARPLSLPSMFLIVAKQHAIRGWDTFLDTFGNPSLFMELPPGTSETAAAEMDLLVRRIVADGRGTIPSGSKFTTVETAQNNCAAFQERARWCKEAIITLGTGGQLTTISAPGSGTLAGNAHQDSFEGLMAGVASSIAATINEQFSRQVLEEAFPGCPQLARFTLAPEPADERAAMAELLGKITAAGYEVETDAAATELVGLPLRRAAQPATPGMPQPPIANREAPEPSTSYLPAAGGQLPVAQPQLPAAQRQLPPRKGLLRRAGEKALEWMGGMSHPFRKSREAYERKLGPISNRETPSGEAREHSTSYLPAAGGQLPVAQPQLPAAQRQLPATAGSESPLTDAELAAFRALATPNPERMTQRQAQVEALLRAAADLDDESAVEEQPIENTCNQFSHSCGKHTGAILHKQKGGRSSKGNPAGKPTQSNTPLKAADGASDREKVDATERALSRQSKPGASGTVQGVIERGGREVDLSAGNPNTFGGQHVARHFKDKNFSQRKAARAIVHGKGEQDIVGSDKRVSLTHQGVGATLATTQKTLNKTERNKKKNLTRKLKIAALQGKKPEIQQTIKHRGDKRQKIITSHLRRNPKK